jgi:ATP-dependent Clp protease protease subunit
MEIQVNEILRMKKDLTNIYVKNTGKSFSQLTKDMDRDNIMDAQASIDYGLADKVIEKRS